MINDDIEIIGISTCGTYPSWIDYTIASFYNHVDKVIVINAGYNINNPESGSIHKLEREHELLQKIDIDNKILEITPTQKEIDNLYSTLCKEGEDEHGRAGNITLATLEANRNFITSNPHWILKLDSDQILYPIARSQLFNLTTYSRITGFRFAQYTDYFHDFSHVTSDGLPDKFTNDGSLFYKSLQGQRYGAQGSPDINTHQQEITLIRTSHMRRICPPKVERYEYFFKRYWYHTYGPNSIMELDYNHETGKKLTNNEIIKEANTRAISSLKSIGKEISKLPYDERIPYEPPLVCKMTPLEYIKKGY